MKKLLFKLRAATFIAGSALLANAPLQAGAPPGLSLFKTIDLSPGADSYAPFQLAINRTTHKIYVPGSITPDSTFIPPDGGIGFGIKVIDTTTNTAVAGIPLGFYDGGSGTKIPFAPVAIAVDDSAAPDGNKIYVVGQVGDDRLFLRTIDGATDTNLTGEGTDLLLPITGRDGSYSSIAANSSNHKIYISNADGDVAVVDGPGGAVLTVLTGVGEDTSHVLIANPAANKVFVLCFQKLTVVIDSTDDSYTSFSTDYSANDAVLDPASGQIFVVGDTSLSSELLALDANTGGVIHSTSAVPERTRGVAVDSSAGTVYVGAPTQATSPFELGEIETYSASSLGAQTSYAIGASILTFDGSGDNTRCYLLDYDYAVQSPLLRNSVGIFDPASGNLTKLTVGYTPGEIAINPRTNRIYVADLKAPEVVVLDGSSDGVLARVTIDPVTDDAPDEALPGFRPIGVSVTTNHFFVTHVVTTPGKPSQTAYLDDYDATTDELVQSIEVNSSTSLILPLIVLDDTRSNLYAVGSMISMPPGFFLNTYDLTADSLVESTPFNDTNDLALNPVTGLIYEAGGPLGPVYVFDPTVDRLVGTVDVGMNPGNIAVNTLTKRAFAVDQSGNTVTVINGTDVEATITGTADQVRSVAVDELTNSVFLGCYSLTPEPESWVAVFDGNNDYGFLGQIDVGRYPERMAFNTATRQLFVSNNQAGAVSVLQSDVPAPPDALGNLSTRLGVETGDNVLIGGFVITGPEGSTKQVLIRGIGPSLVNYGIKKPLADPVVELHDATSILATNDNWKVGDDGVSQEAEIEATGLAPGDDLESAILVTLHPGSYTAIMRGTNEATGVGLVEAYDLSPDPLTKMVNSSTRGYVSTGDNVMIGGVTVSGVDPSRVVLRAIGPSLTQYGVSGALADPTLELYNNEGVLITSNDNWKDENEDAIAATGLAPEDDRESAILATLYPSSYTAIVRGKDNTTGVGLVEAYYLP
jgi:DNA-binding beta-propeller fold protein YncE